MSTKVWNRFMIALTVTLATIVSPLTLPAQESAKNVEQPVHGITLELSKGETLDLEWMGAKFDRDGAVIVGQGQTYYLKAPKPISKIQTSNPEIIRFENLEKDGKIAVLGTATGTADLHIYFADKTLHSHQFRVEPNSEEFESILEQLFPEAKLDIVPIKGTAIFLRGTVETEDEVLQIENIAAEFWPSVHNHIKPKTPSTQLGPRHPRNSSRQPSPPAKVDETKNPRPWIELQTPIGVPAQAHLPNGEPAAFRNKIYKYEFHDPKNSEKNGSKQSSSKVNETRALQKDLQALHTDVKRLIELLEKRKKQKPATDNASKKTSLIPPKGESILFFNANWSAPDQRMMPIVQKLKEEGVNIVSINLEEHPRLVQDMKITSVPTFVKLVDGKEQPALSPYPGARRSGVMSEKELREFVAPPVLFDSLPKY